MTRDRYATEGSIETAHAPGSGGRVLANQLGIQRVRDMQRAESVALESLALALISEVDEHQRFTLTHLRDWHRRWLGEIYVWAGEFRQVNIGKGGFQFASARLVPQLMDRYGKEVLARHTPCADMDAESLAHALAVTHTELILIHPFREGNGRLARLLNTLMALQGGFPGLDYGGIRGAKKREYVGAIHAALDRNYAPMEQVFRAVIRRTLRNV